MVQSLNKQVDNNTQQARLRYEFDRLAADGPCPSLNELRAALGWSELDFVLALLDAKQDWMDLLPWGGEWPLSGRSKGATVNGKIYGWARVKPGR